MSSPPQYDTVCYSYVGNYIPHSLPVEGGWLRPAARERSSHALDGTKLVRNRTCTNSTHQPFHKSFAERNESLDSLVHKRPFLPSPKLYPALAPRRRRMTEFSKLNSVSRSRTIYVGNGSLTLGSNRTCTNYIHPHPPHKSFAELFQKRPSPPRPPSHPRWQNQS